jgi:Tol biopolymer transport system component
VKRLTVLLTVVALFLVCALVVGGGSASAVVSGKNGRIVFARRTCAPTCMWSLLAANPDDSNEIVLAGPYPRVFDDHFIANWSPDAKSVIFMADLGGGQGIWQVSATGTGLHELWAPPPDGTGIDDGPAFTPDGRHIVFTRCCPRGFGYSLWMINADGTGLKHLTAEPSSPTGEGPADTTPQVSPDGKLVVFNRCEFNGCVVATVSINGGTPRDLTDPSLDSEHPNWSPDSKTIVFAFHSANPFNIATVNASGGGVTQLTFDSSGSSSDPCFSPDGTKILFVHSPSTGRGLDLFTMNPTGGGVTQLTRTPGNESNPEWATAN